jgi:acyl carrier protein
MLYKKNDLLEIISDVCGVKIEEIKDDSRFVEDLGADSLDISELVINIEEKFNIHFDNDVVNNIKTVKDLLNYLDTK